MRQVRRLEACLRFARGNEGGGGDSRHILAQWRYKRVCKGGAMEDRARAPSKGTVVCRFHTVLFPLRPRAGSDQALHLPCRCVRQHIFVFSPRYQILWDADLSPCVWCKTTLCESSASRLSVPPVVRQLLDGQNAMVTSCCLRKRDAAVSP